MSTYVIGDVQGCFAELEQLLALVCYDPGSDHLWFVGDLVNRGPDNVRVMNLVMASPHVTCVLGNHDLHFLAVATGRQRMGRSDTLGDLLESPRLPEYIDYLRHLPLLHYDEVAELALVHAGIPPQFDISTSLSLCQEVESMLRSDRYTDFLAAMYGNEPVAWDDNLTGMDRLRIITNYFTRMRYCTGEGALELTHKSDVQPEGFSPWFSFPRPDHLEILFGHWAALEGNTGVDFAIPLDTGCVWGREMTALRLEDRQKFAVKSRQHP